MRVSNERQYRVALGLLARFRSQLEAERAQPPNSGVHPRIHEASVEALRSEVRVLESEIAEYERLKAGAATFPVNSIVELPSVLVKARISRGWTQAELARRLELKEQQIQRYEARLYAGVGLDRIQEVADALGVALEGQANLKDHQVAELDVVPWRPAALAMLLDAVKRQTGHGIHGRTRLQKLLTVWGEVLAREIGAPVFTPRPLHYGGFDDEIGDDIEFLAASGLLNTRTADQAASARPATPLQRAVRRTRVSDSDEEYELTREGIQWLRGFLESDELGAHEKKQELGRLVETVAADYGELSLSRLVEVVYAKFPELAVNSRIKDRVATRIRQRDAR